MTHTRLDESEGTTVNTMLDNFLLELNKSLEGKSCRIEMPAKIAFTMIIYAIAEMKRAEKHNKQEDLVMRGYFASAADFFGVSYGIEAKLMIEELLKGNVRTAL